MKRIYKFPTGSAVPEGAEYLVTIKNGDMNEDGSYKFVWHYFLVEVEE